MQATAMQENQELKQDNQQQQQQQQQFVSTTAPGRVFLSRLELVEHYKSDWHKYNLKRREAGLALLREEDFQARWEAALALRQEREAKKERNGTNHLKQQVTSKREKEPPKEALEPLTRNDHNNHDDSGKKDKENSSGAPDEEMTDGKAQEENDPSTSPPDGEENSEAPPEIEPRQSLFDRHISTTLDDNIQYMSHKYGFFIPDQDYLVDKEGLLGYLHEKIKLGHVCLYCQKIFSTWQGCQKHMINTQHTKIRYERGIDMEELDPFFDFSEANAEFLGSATPNDGEDDDWEDVSEDGEEKNTNDMDVDDNHDEYDDDDDDGLYAGYEKEIARFGFHVTPLGELVFPDGRIVGHRGLARYYKQRIALSDERASVLAARRAAGERLYRGRVYSTNATGGVGRKEPTTLALARTGLLPGATEGRSGNGLLVATGGGGYTALSLYRFRALVKKARREDVQGQRLMYKTKLNLNRMDKKANRLMNGVSVAHAKR